MQVPYHWLREYVDIDLPAQEVARLLAMMGLEVEASREVEGSTVFDIKVTPNRGDCLCVLGVARELAAATGAGLCKPEITISETGPDINSMAAVEILDPDLCPRYSARVITDAVITSSPPWARQRLLQCGMRPINSVVDATNLVMLELGQPLHAFDADLLVGRDGRYQIVVRRARPGETLATLDGQPRELGPDMLVIADAERAVAVAGIMGGANSEVSWSTKTLLLESAHFDRLSIRRSARALGMDTEASYRFERIVDPGGTIRALDRLAQLIVEMGGGEIAQGVVDAYPRVVLPVTIQVRPDKVNAVLGTYLPPARMAEYLQRLELEVKEQGNLLVTAPTFRPDLQEEIDIVEEVARVHGYASIEHRLRGGENFTGKLAPFLAMALQAAEVLRGCGLSQAMTYSLEAADVHDRMHLPADSPLRRALPLRNPKSEEYTQLRTTLLSSMLQALANNARRGVRDVQLFEVGRVFLPRDGDEQPEEPTRLAVAVMGGQWWGAWSLPGEATQSDFYALKGVVELLVGEFTTSPPEFTPAEHPSLHPGRTARITLEGEELGIMGDVAPEVARSYDLPTRAYLLELDLDRLARLARRERAYQPISRFPALRRDLAVVVDERLPAIQLEAAVRAAAGEHLERLELFDMYQGRQVPAGKKSLAYALTFRTPERTLTDREVDEVMQAVQCALAEQIGAQLR